MNMHKEKCTRMNRYRWPWLLGPTGSDYSPWSRSSMGTSTWFRRNCRIRAATHKDKQKIDLGVVIQTYEYTEGKWKLTSRYVYTHEQIQMAPAAGSTGSDYSPWSRSSIGTSTWFLRNCRIRAATHKDKQKIDLGDVIQMYEYT